MSIISSRKSLGSSILKSSTPNRDESLKKLKQLRFEIQEVSSVKQILQELEDNAGTKAYQDLNYRIAHGLSDENLIKVVSEATECVHLLKKEYILFIETLLSVRWLKRCTEIIELYHQFCVNLLTAKTEFISMCLSKILSNLVPLENESEDYVNGKPTEECSEKLSYVHKLLKKLIDIMPMVPVILIIEIKKKFPYHKDASYKIAAYTNNILKILDYCPNMVHDIFELIFEKLLLLDTSVTRSEIEDSEENLDEEDEEEELEANNINETMKLPAAETLDVCLNILFEYFDLKLVPNTSTSVEQQKLIESKLLQYFEEHILRTHNSNHLHFIYFYIASFRKSFQSELLKNLLQKILNRNESAVIRQHAIGYLSSLLSRAKFISIEVVKKYIEHLCNYAHEYLKTCNSVNINLSPKAHLVFHSACQAIFYIIAFRSRGLNLANSQKNLMFLLSLNLSTIVKHPLNPLNYSLPAIVTIFDSIMTKYQIVYCHPILLKNASRKLAIIFSNEQHLPQDLIESVFPFDPFLLKKSGKKITPIYIEYEPEDDEVPVNTINPKLMKRTRNESECDDFIIPSKKLNIC